MINAGTRIIIGASEKGHLGGLGRDDVFLEEQLETVGDRLQQSMPAGAHRSESGLHVADDFALAPGGIGDDQA